MVLPLARAAAVSTGLRLPAVSVGVAPTGGLARGRLRTGRVPRKGVAPHTHLVGVGVRVRARARARARARIRGRPLAAARPWVVALSEAPPSPQRERVP